MRGKLRRMVAIFLSLICSSLACAQESGALNKDVDFEGLEPLQGEAIVTNVIFYMAHPSARIREEMMIYGYARGLGSNAVFRSCIRILSHDQSVRVRRRALHLMRQMKDRMSEHILVDALDDEDDEVKLAAIWAIEALDVKEAEGKLKALAADDKISSKIQNHAKIAYASLTQQHRETFRADLDGVLPEATPVSPRLDRGTQPEAR